MSRNLLVLFDDVICDTARMIYIGARLLTRVVETSLGMERAEGGRSGCPPTKYHGEIVRH